MADKEPLTLYLSYWDQVTLRRLLWRGRSRALRDIERNKERDWKPEPGCADISAETLKNIDGILARMPNTEE